MTTEEHAATVGRVCNDAKERNRARAREYMRKWRTANPEVARERLRAWRIANLAKVREKERERSRKRRAANPERNRGYQLKCRYGVTEKQWDALFAAQGSCCALCKSTDPGDKNGWHTDHCHKRGYKHVRGILCRHCNLTLGYIKDDPERLRRINDYLESNDG